MSAPAWRSLDEETADLLSLLSEDPHPSVEYEWKFFCDALVTVANVDGIVTQNAMRTLLRGKVAGRRVGPFYRRACLEGLLVATQDYEISDDHEGRNAGRPVRIYRLVKNP